ncbi:hypothetical protein [Limosilactobacillus sp.]|uniref:DUF7679 family protein n=1 Tax=Limosilactobacillus sp. TaxID=2773925 RepID=UPI00345E10DF
MQKPNTRSWSFVYRDLARFQQEQQKHKVKHHHRRYENFWVQVMFTGTHQIANYQLPKDLQGPMRQHQKDSQNFKDVLLDSLINVPITEYRDGQAKIKPARVIRILILPVRTHDPRWIARSQFIKPNYPLFQWLLGTVKLDKEVNFLTHDFKRANQQRITATIQQYRQEQIQFYRKRYIQKILVCLGLIVWLIITLILIFTR